MKLALSTLAAGLAALQTFLLSTPGIHVEQYVFIAVAGANVVVAAMAAVLNQKPS